MITFFLILTIFMTVWWTTLLIGGVISHDYVPPLNIIIFAASWTGLITHFIGIW